MLRKTLFALLSLAGGLAAGGAWADPVAEGAAIARNGKPGVQACEMCHGAGAGAFPLLVGQSAEYLARQLADFRSGKRENPMMTPIAKGLSEAQSNAVAEFYSRQPRRTAPGAGADTEMLERGFDLATIGDKALGSAGCDTCHGTKGAGGEFPALAGQNANYLAAQLKAFREGKRANDTASLMQSVARQLKDDDIAAVAAFYREIMTIEVEVIME